MSKTKTPPVDAAELVTILATLGACGVFFGGVAAYEARDALVGQSTLLAPALFVLAGVCMVAALIVHVLRPKG